jgi:predicted amidohydrolase
MQPPTVFGKKNVPLGASQNQFRVMKLLLLQTDIHWLAPDENRRRVENLTSSIKPGEVDLVALPEMFTTGFAVDPAGVAEPASDDGSGDCSGAGVGSGVVAGSTLDWMRGLAARLDAAVAGSVAVAVEQPSPTGLPSRFFNRHYFVRPDGSFSFYDKRHLFSFAGEHHRYTAGTQRVVVEWRGWRILLQTCYDLRFPVFARNRGDYDMVLYVANWPTVRRRPWDTLLRARAIENLCYAAGVNRVGSDPYTTYSGGTALIDFRGEALAAAADNTEEAIFCDLDLDALRAFRTKFPALNDADGFLVTN